MKHKKMRLLKRVIALGLCLSLLSAGNVMSVKAEEKGGFYVSGTSVKDANGNDFIMRGINVPHAWFQNKTEITMDAIAELGCNSVRVVCADGDKWQKTTADELEEIIAMCKRNKMVCVLEVHDATGSDQLAPLESAANYWISVKDVLNKNKDTVIVNIANEWYGTWSGADWANGYKTVIPMLRDAGIENLLMVDCAGWGQYPRCIKDYGKEVFAADKLKNTMFSMHLYEYAGGTEAMVKDNIDNALSIGIPVCVGEFGQKHTDGDVDEETILSYCKDLGVGYLAWSWKGNNAPVDFLDLTNTWDGSELTEWGDRLFNGVNGIKETSKTCSVFDGMVSGGENDDKDDEPDNMEAYVIDAEGLNHYVFTDAERALLSKEGAIIDVVATTKIEQAGWLNLTLLGEKSGKKADIMYPAKAGKKTFSMPAAEFFENLGLAGEKVAYDSFHVYTWNATTLNQIIIRTQKGESEQPVEPETPIEPEQPVEPETPIEPEQPVEPDTPVEPEQPVEPDEPVIDEPVVGEKLVLTDVEFGTKYDLSSLRYNDIKKIVVKFKGNANGYSGAIVLGEWVEQKNYNQDDTKDFMVSLDVTRPQSYLTIYKWWSNYSLEIDSVELFY